ncbi:RNA polymerase sigma factor [Dyadobacter psychrophilus]|uniref:RNA polymerase sigma-70 factor, ECF subfamily n=1 Tax=Dyadobacter psychrophilus TaxID=651661 RepID=A0A1T5H5S5_9BACT|nr:RNA polymerase subunit sigma-24 [Dyadobacter psychrophilus]SKC15959.1 RNA polymerase sigma-70 factor, ECF subfamily [Dyadobacter psychrophilus]
MNFPNQQILYQIKQGDEAAFTQLCSYFYFPAVKFCAVLLKDEKEAETITESVFAKIWDERVDIETEDNFQAYLFLNLKSEIFGQMNRYKDPASKEMFLNKINSFSDNQRL